ncbi:unnamed protein product [Linum trigynum]|uniref:Uncharacterized protein n=1 Tax=Linum trigynum TaxID=586398 RepID=A0AAV2FT02_9ROSI
MSTLLRELRDMTDLPWLVCGDFNLIQRYKEKNGLNLPNVAEMDIFNDALEDCKLEDLRYYGKIFTWANNQLMTPT